VNTVQTGGALAFGWNRSTSGSVRLEKRKEAGRAIDRKLLGKAQEVVVPRDQQRLLGLGEGDQVVIPGVEPPTSAF
jgi:hypothetical protein